MFSNYWQLLSQRASGKKMKTMTTTPDRDDIHGDDHHGRNCDDFTDNDKFDNDYVDFKDNDDDDKWYS